MIEIKGFRPENACAFVAMCPAEHQRGDGWHQSVDLYLTPDAARDVARRLLAAADEAEGVDKAACPAEPSGPVQASPPETPASEPPAPSYWSPLDLAGIPQRWWPDPAREAAGLDRHPVDLTDLGNAYERIDAMEGRR